jgi:hypothetical protein
MVSFGKKGQGAASWSHSLLVPNEPEVVPAADAFEGWMNDRKLKDYCASKVDKSSGHHEELMWQVMAGQFDPEEGKRQLSNLLGFQSDKILQKAEQYLGTKPGMTLAGPKPDQPVAQVAAPVAAAPVPLIDANDAVDFFQPAHHGPREKAG